MRMSVYSCNVLRWMSGNFTNDMKECKSMNLERALMENEPRENEIKDKLWKNACTKSQRQLIENKMRNNHCSLANGLRCNGYRMKMVVQ